MSAVVNGLAQLVVEMQKLSPAERVRVAEERLAKSGTPTERAFWGALAKKLRLCLSGAS